MRLIEYLFPCQCVVCSKVGQSICPRCIKGLSRTLPMCCICNKLNNGYLTHNSCSETQIHYYTGWYISKEIERTLYKKVERRLWNSHLYLLDTLISRLNLKEIVKMSKKYPIQSERKNIYQLNKYLCNNIEGTNKDKNILFVGERLENIQEIKEIIRGLPRNPLNIYILSIFVAN